MSGAGDLLSHIICFRSSSMTYSLLVSMNQLLAACLPSVTGGLSPVGRWYSSLSPFLPVAKSAPGLAFDSVSWTLVSGLPLRGEESVRSSDGRKAVPAIGRVFAQEGVQDSFGNSSVGGSDSMTTSLSDHVLETGTCVVARTPVVHLSDIALHSVSQTPVVILSSVFFWFADPVAKLTFVTFVGWKTWAADDGPCGYQNLVFSLSVVIVRCLMTEL